MSTHAPPMVLPERYGDALLLLFQAMPLPLPTAVIARSLFQSGACSRRTAIAKAHRTLSRLREYKLIDAETAPVRFGRSPSYWYVLKAGLDVLQDEGRISQAALEAKPRHHRSHDHVIRNRVHELHVAAVKAELLYAARVERGIALTSVVHDATAWSQFRIGTPPQDVAIAPDLVATLRVSDEAVVLLAEVQGTADPLARGVEDKVRRYRDFLASGAATERYRGCRNFRVLFVTFSPDEEGIDRRNNVAEAVAALGMLEQMVHVATATALTEQGLWAPIWLRPFDLKALMARLPEPQRARLVNARHKGNAVRDERDQIITKHVQLRRLFT